MDHGDHLYIRANNAIVTGGSAGSNQGDGVATTFISTATGSSIPPLPDREVITHLLGLNPDQPFIDWAGNKGLTDLSMAFQLKP